MKRWWQRLRGALGLGLLWAVGGLAIAGGLELLDNVLPAARPLTRLVDMWPQTLALLGFLAGVIFGMVLGIAAARRRFDQLSLPGLTAIGASAGLLLGVALGAPIPVVAVLTLASAIGGASTLALARRAERRAGLSSAPATNELSRSERESRELPGAER